MHIHVLKTGPYEVNTYVVWNEPEQTVIIDPGFNPGKIKACLEKLSAVPSLVLLTHGHADHISALDGLLSDYPYLRVGMSPQDSVWAFSPANRIYLYDEVQKFPEGRIDFLKDGDAVRAGTLLLKVMGMPGHTPGGLCFISEDGGTLFSGDTLFRGSVGRTDLPGGNFGLLTKSLARLMSLDDKTDVFPGHGDVTTIGDERLTNPYCVVE